MIEAIERLKSSPVERFGQRVITLGQMDEVHGRPAGTAGRNFRRHRGELREGEDYFTVPVDVLRRPDGQRHGADHNVLLTESGYLLLVKVFRDPLAWNVQRDLVAGYFRARERQVGDAVLAMLLDEVRDLRNRMWSRYEAELKRQGERISALEQGAKRLRSGARQGLFGRQGGRQRLPKPKVSPVATLPFPPEVR